MREMRGEVEKKTPKKRWRISHFYYVTVFKSGKDWDSARWFVLVVSFVYLEIVLYLHKRDTDN